MGAGPGDAGVIADVDHRRGGLALGPILGEVVHEHPAIAQRREVQAAGGHERQLTVEVSLHQGGRCGPGAAAVVAHHRHHPLPARRAMAVCLLDAEHQPAARGQAHAGESLPRARITRHECGLALRNAFHLASRILVDETDRTRRARSVVRSVRPSGRRERTTASSRSAPENGRARCCRSPPAARRRRSPAPAGTDPTRSSAAARG